MYKRRYAFLDRVDQAMEKALQPGAGLLVHEVVSA
jgi:hypothetical protein